MICYICKKEFQSFDGIAICENCNEAAYLCNAMYAAYNEWKVSLYKEDLLWVNTKLFIRNLFNRVDKSKKLIEQAIHLRELIEKQIKEHLKFYHKDDLIVGSLVIKEAVRRYLLKVKQEENETWKMINEYEVLLILIRLTLEINKKDFIGASLGELEDGYSNFITAISLARFCVILTHNIDTLDYIDNNSLSLEEITFKPIVDDDLELFYSEYLEMGLNEKPEDENIKNDSLKKKLDLIGISKKQREKYANNFIKQEFGFNITEANGFSTLLLKEEFPSLQEFQFFVNNKEALFHKNLPYLAIYDKNILKNYIFKNKKEILEAIIRTFNLNEIVQDKPNKERIIELKSIYEVKNLIIFGRVDLIQNVSAFEKFAYSGHYIDLYKKNIGDKKIITELQQKLSSYLAYVIADRLMQNGYILPMEKLPKSIGGEYVPRAEIKKIKVNGKNILQGRGDIDVLALDEKKQEIILIELKHYKPAITQKQLFDKSKIKNKNVIYKIKEREEIIKKNINEVKKFIGKEDNNIYRVKSIFVTSRPHYYATTKELGIKYMTWTQLLKGIAKKDI